MSAVTDYASGKKTISQENTADQLCDALCDTALVVAGDPELFRAQLADALRRAQLHYDAEGSGDSDGLAVLVETETGETIALSEAPVADLTLADVLKD